MTPNLDPNEADWFAALERPRHFPLRFSVVRGRHPMRWRQLDVRLRVDARPLATLLRSALLGARVYELFSIRRSGDVLRYLWAGWADAPCREPELAHWIVGEERTQGLSFLALDRRFWRPESDWLDDDAGSDQRAWWAQRRTSFWSDLCSECMEIVTRLQAQVRASDDILIRHELALMDSGRHRRDAWPTREQVGALAPAPSPESSLPAELIELIVSTARREDVRGVSCPLADLSLWRALFREQRQRADRTGLAPREALFLAGPQGGLLHLHAEDFGASLFVPFEGAHEADLFVQPSWFHVDMDSAQRAQSIRAGLWGKTCKYFLSPRDHGDFAGDSKLKCGGWVLYGPNVRAPTG